MGKFFLEVVQDFDGSYYANMVINGNPVQDLKEYVDYNTLRKDIRDKTGIEILKRKDMVFQQWGRKKYAYIDNTQYREDCRVTLDEMRHGFKPDFNEGEITGSSKLSLTDQIKAAETKCYAAQGKKHKALSNER